MTRLAVLAFALFPACTIYVSAEESDDDPPDGNLDAAVEDFYQQVELSDVIHAHAWHIHQPLARQNDPRAQDPSHVYLQLDQDAVVLETPTIPDQPGVFAFQGPVAIRDPAGIGFLVYVNSRLHYDIYMAPADEQELEPGLLEAWRDQGLVYGRITLFPVQTGDGITEGVSITAYVDGQPVGGTTPPWTIEARP